MMPEVICSIWKLYYRNILQVNDMILREESLSHKGPVIPVKLGVAWSFIIKSDKAVIVDTGYSGNSDRILHRLRTHSVRLQDISLIIITHGHIDHYGSAAELRKITGAPIAMHKADAERIKLGVNYIGSPVGLAGRILKSFYKGSDTVGAKPLEVDITFDTDLDLQQFGIGGMAIHTPGHTEGSVSLILSTGEAIVGDLVMGSFLFGRLPRYPLFVNDMAQLKMSIKKIADISPTVIYVSHGRAFSSDLLRKFLVRS
jgi:hydroxyacylglutathione hydrolase